MKKNLVLVTGGSGFVGSHCIVRLLGAGYEVRTTIRSLRKKSDILGMLENGGIARDLAAGVDFREADLTKDADWAEAARDCEYVLHVATPISLSIPKTAEEVIRPAVDGTVRVLRAARDAGVKRVVLTSSFAAVGYGNDPGTRLFDETDWTNPKASGLSAYVRSKALAERAAWDFMASEGGTMELAVVNPMAIFGPLLGKSLSSGHQLLKNLLDGAMKAVPRIDFGIVDVRDVADLHLLAMTDPKAKNQRFLALGGGVMTFHEIAMTLREELGKDAEKVPTKTVADWVLRLLAPFSPKAKQVLPMLGQKRNCSNEKARTLLGWKPRPNREAVVAAGQSLVSLAAKTESKT